MTIRGGAAAPQRSPFESPHVTGGTPRFSPEGTMKVQIFDPSMCCSTGVCGPNVDPALVRFASDVNWLKEEGVEVERYNLSQQPAAFSATTKVRDALQHEGLECLPLILIHGEIAFKGRYPARRELADALGLEPHARRL